MISLFFWNKSRFFLFLSWLGFLFLASQNGFAAAKQNILLPLDKTNLSTNNMKLVFEYVQPNKKNFQDEAIFLESYKAKLSNNFNYVITLFQLQGKTTKEFYLVYLKMKKDDSIQILGSLHLNEYVKLSYEYEYEIYPYLISLPNKNYGLFFISSQTEVKFTDTLTQKEAALFELGPKPTILNKMPFGCLYNALVCKDSTDSSKTCSTFNLVDANIFVAKEYKNRKFDVVYVITTGKKSGEETSKNEQKKESHYIFDESSKTFSTQNAWENDVCPSLSKN